MRGNGATRAEIAHISRDGGLRPAAGGVSEEAFLYLLFATNRQTEMALMPISPADKEFLLQVQFRSMNDTYRKNYPAARYDIIELDGWPVGRIVSEVQTDCVYMSTSPVLPQVQGIGIGTTVLAAALEEPRRLGRARPAALVLVSLVGTAPIRPARFCCGFRRTAPGRPRMACKALTSG